jgi:hypothetical protein
MIFRETLITPLVQIQQAQVIYTLDRASSEGHARKTTKRVSASDDGSILFAAEPGQRHHRFKPLVSLDKRVLIAGVTGHEMFQQKKIVYICATGRQPYHGGRDILVQAIS